MALNKKIKDELHALKGLDSSSVYDEEDRKKKKAAQAKAKASEAKEALKSVAKAAPGAGLKNKAGSVTVNKSTRPTPRTQEKQENDNYLTRLRTELQGRLSDMRTNPGAIVDRYEDDESTRRRKDLLIGSMLNSDKLLGVDTDGVYDARQTVQNMKGLSAQTAYNARRAEDWETEAEGFGNTTLGSFYGSAKDTLDRLAGQLDAAATNIMSPVNRMKEAAKEEEFAGLLKYFTDLNWGTGARTATDDEIGTGSDENRRQIALLEEKKNNGTITKDEQFLLDTLMKVQQKYDSGNVTVYDNDLDETAAGRLAAQDAYLQTRANVDYMGRQARAEGQQMRAEAMVDSVLGKMADAGAAAEDYMMERDALYDEYMNAGALKTFIGNRGRYKLLNYTPEQYAAYRWTEENEPEKLDALEEFLDVRANAQISKDAKEYWSDPNRNDSMNNIVGNTVLGLVGRLSGIMHTADLALQSIAVAGGVRNEIDYGRLNAASVGGEAAVAAQTQKLAEIGSLSDLVEGLDGTWLGDKNLGDLYRAGVDSAASIMNGALFGAGTGLATGTQVYSSAYTDAKERGATDGQAGLFATFQAAAEGLGEQVSFGSFQNLIVARGLDKKIGGKILLGLFQSAEEAGQEYVTEGMNVLADNLIMQELSEEEKSRQEFMAVGYDPTTAAEMAREESNERLLDAALGGFIGGALRSGSSYAGQGIDAGVTAIDDYATGSAIQKNNNAGAMAQLMSEVSGQEVSPETSKRKLGKQQREFLNKAGEYLAGADDAVRDIAYGKISNIAQAAQKPLEGTSQATKEKASKRTAAMRKSDEGASVGGESVTVQGFVKTAGKSGDARLNIKKADGTLAEANMEDVTFDSKTAEVYSYAADMATPELANMFRLSVQPDQMAGIERVANGYSQAYDMAKAGFKEASVRASSLTDALTDEQVSAAYKLGADARSAGQIQAITAARQRAEANMGKAWKGGKATFDSSVVVDALDDEQKNQIDMASAVTGAMGVNVVFFESKADETGRYTRENGSYNRKTNTIYIDVNAGRNYKGDSMTKTALLRTLSHEVTHAIQRNSPEIYAELRDTVTDILGDAKGATIEDLIDRKLAQDGSLTTRDAAMDELVADACEKMLEDSDAAQRLAEAHPEAAKTFFRKVGELLTKLKEAIKAAFKGRQLSTEAQLVMKDVERYQQLVELWTKGVMQTAEVIGREQGETADSETENAAIFEETAAEGENITSEELVGEYGEPARPAETHIDNRTWENVGDRSVKAFQNEYKYARMYMGPAAKALLADANASLPSERYRTMDGEWGGQQRQTTEVLAELKDRGGWSWEQLKTALGVMADRYDVGDLEQEIPDTAIIKRIEIVLDEILTEGYDAMEGAHIVPDAGYVAYKNKLPGAAEYSNVVQDEGITFEDYTQFQAREYNDNIELTNQDTALFYRKWGEIKSKKDAAFQRTSDGYYIFAINDKLVYTKGSYDKPKIHYVMRINLDDETAIDNVRHYILMAERGECTYGEAKRIFEDVYYEEVVDGYDTVIHRSDARENGRRKRTARGEIYRGVEEGEVDSQYQTREEAISTRYALANMLETDAASGEEVAWLRGYKNQFAKLEQLLGEIDQNKKIIRELMFKKGRTEAESIELQKARDRNKILQDKVASIDEGLLKLEKADVIRSLVAREEQKIRDKEAEKRREGIAKVRENQRNTAIRKNIQRRAKKLDRMLRQPSDKEHIPEGLRGAMLDMMEIFTGSEAAFGGAKADRERLYRAQREYEAMRGDEDNADLASRYDEDTADRLRQLADLMKDRKISDFNNAELTQLSMVIEHFEHLVRDQNDEFAQSRRKITEGYAEQIWQQTMTMKGRKENAITGSALVKALKHLGHANVIPPYFYKHLGGAMGKLGNDLLKAEGRYGVNMNKAAKRLDEIRRKYEHDKWATKKGDILKLETEIGDTLELTREQALGIWASAKRERLNTVQRAAHLRDGGVILEKPARKLGRKGQEINVTPTKISQRDIQQIDKWLTDQQKAYADEMVGYISRDMAALGNETSMELAGYKKFGEGYYYPYKTSSDFRRTELGKVEDALIKNMGFTKSVTRNAKTPVVITDFSATVADHVNAMIMYNAFAVAQDQMMRVYDFKLDDSNSVKNLLRNAFGDEIPAYIEQHMRDLYGGVSPDRDAGLINWTISAHKKQAVLGSASVVVQQPTALIRAMSQINPKYFVGQRVEGGFNEAMDYAGTAVIKDIGGFDSGVGRGATDWLNGKPKDWQNHAIKSGLDTVSDWAGLGAEYADKLAWTAIWKAVKREQADKYKVDINSQELKEIAGERFDEVVRLTQVYDSVMTRSQLMRNKNLFWKMATSFMSEPTVTWNMMYDAGIEAFKNKKTGAAIGITASVLVSVILTNLAKAAVMAARDDDDEEATYLERYVKNAVEGLVNDVVPFNYMPIVRDIYSKLQGYEVERADMGIINDILAAGEVMLDEDKAPIAKVKSLVTLVSIMTGLPAKNIWRDVEAAFNTAGATPQSEARPGWLENALRTGAIDATPIGKWFDLTDSKANNADRLYEAILDGDMAGAEELREHLKVYNNADDDKAVDSLLRNRIKEGYEGGEITETEAVDMLTKHAGLKKYDAEKRVSQWSYVVETGTEYGDLKDAYLEGEITKTEAIRARAEYGGSDDDDAQATVAKWEYELNTGMAYDDMKDAYIAGDITRAEAINARVKYGGADKIDAEKTLQQWEYEKKSGIPYADMKDAFIAGELTEKQAISARMQYGGAREAEAMQTIAEWQYEKDTGRSWSDMKADYIAGRIKAKDVTNAQVKYAGAFEKDVKAQILKWDYEKDTGIAYNDMKGAYIEGDITAKEAVTARIKYGGMETEDAELDVSKWDFEIDYGYDYDDMSDYYELGKISKSEAVAARIKYGKSEKDDAYFAVTGWQYEMDTGKEWEGKFTKVHDAVDSRNVRALQTAIKEVYDNSAYTDGKKAASALTSNITSTYKPMYIKASATERAAMEEMLLDAYQYAYELAGERYYGDSYKLKQIRKWLEQ